MGKQSDSRRVILQKDLSSKDYSGLMMDELEDLSSKDYSGIYLENFTGRRVYCCYK
jgi:hypothetical protein